MTHLKRLTIPTTWPIPRKGDKFAVTPSPGPHGKRVCMPLRIVFRDCLKYADSAKETRQILNQGKVLVDRTPRKSSKFPVGLMDIIGIPEIKEHFRVIITSSGVNLEKIKEDQAFWKFCKITGKTTLKKGVSQLNLHDGRNVLTKKASYKVGDTLMLSLPDQRILKHIKFEKGSQGLIIAGRNAGQWGKVKEIEERDHMLERPTVTINTGKKEIKTLREYIFIADLDAKAPSGAQAPSGAKASSAKPAKAKAKSAKPSKKSKPAKAKAKSPKPKKVKPSKGDKK